MSTPGQSALCVNPTTGGAVAETTRALLVAMDQWVDRGVEPPPSNYPTLADRGRERDRGDEDDDDDDDDDDDRKRRDRDDRHSSRHGKHNAATLVSLQEASEFFPAIPGVSFPTVMNQYELLDFGRRFGKTGAY